jgi:hypothetical protein
MCNFKSKNKTDYRRHCASRKHKNTEHKIPPLNHHKITVKRIHHVCHYCDDKFSRLDSLKRHEGRCAAKKILDAEIIIKKNNKKIQALKKEYEEKLQEKDKKIMWYEEKLHYYRQIITQKP